MEIKDSGKRQTFSNGMIRDTAEGKVDFTLALDGPMFERWAAHLTRAAETKYPKRNWMKANDVETMERFKVSATRHFMQLLRGDTDEDHAAAVFFNINGWMYVKDKLDALEGGDVDRAPHADLGDLPF